MKINNKNSLVLANFHQSISRIKDEKYIIAPEIDRISSTNYIIASNFLQ